MGAKTASPIDVLWTAIEQVYGEPATARNIAELRGLLLPICYLGQGLPREHPI